jgi:hypothetical protein
VLVVELVDVVVLVEVVRLVDVLLLVEVVRLVDVLLLVDVVRLVDVLLLVDVVRLVDVVLLVDVVVVVPWQPMRMKSTPSAMSCEVPVTMWIVYDPVAGDPTEMPDDRPVSTTR